MIMHYNILAIMMGEWMHNSANLKVLSETNSMKVMNMHDNVVQRADVL